MASKSSLSCCLSSIVYCIINRQIKFSFAHLCGLFVHVHLGEEQWVRGNNKGAQLQRMTQARLAKLPVLINEGDIRPLQHVVAAKYATECNIIVRNYIPVFPRWKDYTEPTA